MKLAAAPQDLMPKGSPYKTDSSIVNLGDHREPKMEAAVGVQPDLIINGQRFEEKYDQFKQLAPEAALVDIDIRKDKPFGDELKRQITIAGEIFGKKDEAAKLVSDFDASVARVKAAYKSATPASDVIAGSAPLQNVTAVTKKQIVYMPTDTYLNEGIQTYTKFFNDVADAMEKSA